MHDDRREDGGENSTRRVLEVGLALKNCLGRRFLMARRGSRPDHRHCIPVIPWWRAVFHHRKDSITSS